MPVSVVSLFRNEDFNFGHRITWAFFSSWTREVASEVVTHLIGEGFAIRVAEGGWRSEVKWCTFLYSFHTFIQVFCLFTLNRWIFAFLRDVLASFWWLPYQNRLRFERRCDEWCKLKVVQLLRFQLIEASFGLAFDYHSLFLVVFVEKLLKSVRI